MMRDTTRVCIVYPADPLGVIPGGIDTCIKGIIRWAPEDIEISMVGVCSGDSKLSIGDWNTIRIGEASTQFMPLLRLGDPGKQTVFPLTLKFMAHLARRLSRISLHDVVQFHRLEPALLFRNAGVGKVAFIHQDMRVLTRPGSDIRWKHLPGAYFQLEKRLIPKLDHLFVVHSQAAEAYREQFPQMKGNIDFLPTWVDTDIFSAPYDRDYAADRRNLRQRLGVDAAAKLVAYVGRLEEQKNPRLLVNSFARLRAYQKDAHLVIVGDGSMRRIVDAEARSLGIGQHIHFAGLLSQSRLAELLRLCDLFLLTSRYEGMPRAVLEALACGLPVVTTRVGEVGRVVHDGINGQIIDEHDASVVGEAAARVLEDRELYPARNCTAAIKAYTPARVLEPVFDCHRRNRRKAAR